MTRTQKRGICWLIAAAMTAAVMVFVLLCTDIRYAVNDDAAILRAFVGAESGEPASFHIYIHGLLAWPLCLLSRCFPALPWFSYVQLTLLALSCMVIAKSIMQCFVNRDLPLYGGVLLAAAFLASLCLKYVIRLTFTQTSALLGAAAVLQIFSVDHERGAKRVIVGMAGAAALVALCYALRQITALPVLAFCALAFVIVYAQHYFKQGRSIRPMVVSLALVAVMMAGLAGVREIEIANSGAQDYLAWQEANTDVIDFYGLANVPDEAIDMVGWDDATLRMAGAWCFLDSDLSTENFLVLDEYMKAHDARTFSDRLRDGWSTLEKAFHANPQDMRCLLVPLLCGALALVLGLIRRKWTVVLGVLGALGGAAVMLLVLAMGGRMPLRAVLMAVLPASAALAALLIASLPRKMSLPAVLCAALLAAWCASGFLPGLLLDPDDDGGSAFADLQEYALFDPECLFIYDDTLVGADLRVFPDYSEGVPNNLTFWGGWGMRSPENRQLFERFDIDLDDFDPYTLLRDDVYVASGCIDPPPMVLLDWLRAKIGPNVECELYSEYGYVYIFHFYEY